jgi:hypothetical protein
LEDLGQKTPRDFVFFRYFSDKTDFFKGLSGKIQDASYSVISLSGNLHGIYYIKPAALVKSKHRINNERTVAFPDASFRTVFFLVCGIMKKFKEAHMRYRVLSILLSLLLVLLSCTKRQDGMVAGTVAATTAGTRVAAMQNSRTVSSVDVNMQDGSFRMTLQPGIYDVRVSVPSSPLPVMFPGILVEPGKITTIPPIDLAQSSGHAVLSGRVFPGGNATMIELYAEGRERAAVQADGEGRYQFTGLSAGHYTLQASVPAYATDAVELAIANDRSATQNIRLLYAAAIDGVDWSTGKIRVRGVGLPPAGAVNTAASREMTRRAALADAQRNMLRALDQIKVGPDQSLKSFLGEKTYTEKIQGFVQGYKITGERELGGGKIEIELELSLTGQDGLSQHLAE